MGGSHLCPFCSTGGGVRRGRRGRWGPLALSAVGKTGCVGGFPVADGPGLLDHACVSDVGAVPADPPLQSESQGHPSLPDTDPLLTAWPCDCAARAGLTRPLSHRPVLGVLAARAWRQISRTRLRPTFRCVCCLLLSQQMAPPKHSSTSSSLRASLSPPWGQGPSSLLGATAAHS